MLNKNQREEIICRRVNGESLQKIAQDLGVSKATVINHVKDSRNLISNATNLEKDAFLARLHMTATKRFEHKIELMKKISDELLNRDWSKVPSEKLLDMLFSLEEKTDGHISVKLGEMKKLDPFANLVSALDSDLEFITTEI